MSAAGVPPEPPTARARLELVKPAAPVSEQTRSALLALIRVSVAAEVKALERVLQRRMDAELEAIHARITEVHERALRVLTEQASRRETP